MSRKLNGAFINTAQASCSIHESGKMVFSCLAESDLFELDYYSLDTVDIAALSENGVVKLRDGVGGHVAKTHYDFWVFNWHFITMAMDLEPQVIASLSGPKFTVVLELAPGDPLQLVPPGVFDAYIALDPGTARTGAIYPFPRPLDGDPQTPTRPCRSVPIIGSFGFGTPGKGFESLVAAVNDEFERAIVRINIPSGDFIGSDVIHRTSYPKYIERICREIAKPGIEVKFTYDFMSSDELIEWCKENDLNCFMYTRCQPGLSATTDQAIVSGQPLVTSSNDTFRHIHQYIPPYPLTSLRDAIAGTRPLVAAMQRDWSKAAFNSRFAELLADFGLLDRAASPALPDARCSAGWYKMLVVGNKPTVAGIHDRVNRFADAMRRTGKYKVAVGEARDRSGLQTLLAAESPDALVLADRLDFAMHGLGDFSGPIIQLDPDATAVAVGSPGWTTVPFTPIVPYQTVASPLEAVPTIWLAGFASSRAHLEAQLNRIATELPGCQVNVLLPPEGPQGPHRDKLRPIIDRTDRITVSLASLPDSGEATIELFAPSHLIMVNNDPLWSDHLLNIAELAMITERAVAVGKVQGFQQLSGLVASYDEHDLKTLIGMGSRAQIAAVSAFSEGRTYARIDAVLSPQLGARRKMETEITNLSYAEAVAPNPANSREQIELVHQLYHEHLGRGPDPQGLQHYLRLLTNGKTANRIRRDLAKSDEAVALRRARQRAGADITSVRDLLSLRGTEFVRAAYLTLLGREPDEVGLSHHLGILADGESRAAVLAGIHSSPEGRAHGADLPGLHRLVRAHQRGWPRWPKWRRKRKIAAQRRALNIAEQRLVEIADTISHQASAASVLQQILDQLPAIPESSDTRSDALTNTPPNIVVPKGAPGTVYLLVGINGFLSVPALEDLKRLTEALLNEEKLVRLVTWDPIAKRFELLSRGVLEKDAWELVVGGDSAWYPYADEAILSLDTGSIAKDDLLMVYGPLRSPNDPEVIVETNVILEARRLNLTSLFIFHGASAVNLSNSSEPARSSEEQYMQALLLADCLIATSDLAMTQLEAFFSAHQRAVLAPVRAVEAGPPSADCPIDWQQFTRAILRQAVALRHPARFIDCTVFSEPQLQTRLEQELGGAMVQIGIASRPKGRSETIKKPASNRTETVSADGSKVQWLLIDGDRPVGDLKKAIAEARETRQKLALLLFDTTAIARLAKRKQGLHYLTACDMVICASSAIASAVRDEILATRYRFPSAKDRLISLDAYGEIGPRIAERLARLLANRQPQAWQMPLPQIPFERAKQLLPGIDLRPKLSLCISTYNRAKWLQASLANIARQIPNPREDLEIVVVDNTSTDETAQLPELFRHRRDFRFYRNPFNVGMLGNLAVTAQRARGEFVWILGDDDLTRSGAIENILRLLSAKPQLELVYMNYGYTSEPTPDNVQDLDAFLDAFNVLQPPCPDEEGDVASIAAKTENFYTAIYSHVYRRDHALRSYCQDTSGRIFATMRSCIPTTCYVLGEMPNAPAYWIGEPALVVNSNVSWADYGPMLDLEHLPESWDMAERIGCPVEQVDMRRSNRLWLVEMMWRQLFEDDRVGNINFISAPQVIMRLRHLPEFEKYVPDFKRIYAEAHDKANPAAAMPPETLFRAFAGA